MAASTLTRSPLSRPRDAGSPDRRCGHVRRLDQWPRRAHARRRGSRCGRARTAASCGPGPARRPWPAAHGSAARRRPCTRNPVEHSIPRASSSISRLSPAQPGNVKCALPGSRDGPPSTSDWPGSPLSIASGTISATSATSSSRSSATRAASAARASTAARTAAASATMAGTSSVPDRTSRSCPPPCSTGVHATSRPSSSTPAPNGPPSLCPVRVSADARDAAKSTGSAPTACTASVWNGMPCSAHVVASSRTGLTVPTSLLAHMTLTIATLAGSSAIAARSVSSCTRPNRPPRAASARRPRARPATRRRPAPRGARRSTPAGACGPGRRLAAPSRCP